MDKNQIIGIILIVAIFIGFAWYSMPTEEEQRAIAKKRDSLVLVQKQNHERDSLAKIHHDEKLKEEAEIVTQDTTISDSTINAALQSKYGVFGIAAKGEDKIYTIRNKNITVKITSRGGYMYSAELNKFQTYDSLPLFLFDSADNRLSMNLFVGNKKVTTGDMYFQATTEKLDYIAENGSAVLALRMKASNGGYLEYKYTLEPDSYLLKYDISFVKLDNVIATNRTDFDVSWKTRALRHEKGADWENKNTTIYYKLYKDDTDYLTETTDDKKENIPTKVKWIAYKNQFFSQVLIPNTYTERNFVAYEKDQAQTKYLKTFSSSFSIPYGHKPSETFGFNFYLGPNEHKGLKNISFSEGDDLELEALIPMGWGIFGWVNKFAIVPLFNFLSSFGLGYGLIILLLTIIIKGVLFPLTYKSYKSSAKMRVLKPQIEALNKKHEKSDAMKRQQATQKLYKSAGVNPMGGCLPMLLQMPILIAMFRFFPTSIELRQQSFLWAEDLSTYDSIWDFPGDFSIWMYGDHVSLFTLLMAVGILISTKLNGNNQMDMGGGGKNNPLAGVNMKMMMYLMPVMMIFWFNNYSAGLSYYYFLSNLITIGQTLLIRRMIDEDELLASIEKNKKKNPKVKKTKFQARLEEMQKMQKQQQNQKNKKSSKKR